MPEPADAVVALGGRTADGNNFVYTAGTDGTVWPAIEISDEPGSRVLGLRGGDLWLFETAPGEQCIEYCYGDWVVVDLASGERRTVATGMPEPLDWVEVDGEAYLFQGCCGGGDALRVSDRHPLYQMEEWSLSSADFGPSGAWVQVSAYGVNDNPDYGGIWVLPFGADLAQQWRIDTGTEAVGAVYFRWLDDTTLLAGSEGRVPWDYGPASELWVLEGGDNEWSAFVPAYDARAVRWVSEGYLAYRGTDGTQTVTDAAGEVVATIPAEYEGWDVHPGSSVVVLQASSTATRDDPAEPFRDTVVIDTATGDISPVTVPITSDASDQTVNVRD